MTRYIVYGAGAIGGSIGASLFERNRDVALIARGAHYQAIADSGLRFGTPNGSSIHKIPVVDHPAKIEFGSDDVVMLTVKTQDTVAALEALRGVAPADIPIICVQNAVENERITLRLFPNVYGAMIISPATHLSPGVVVLNAAPSYGLIQIGQYPSGLDALAEKVAEDLRDASWSAEASAQVQRWKYGKLIENLGNTTQLIIGLDARSGEIADRARAEGAACFKAAGIDFVPTEELRAQRVKFFKEGPAGTQVRAGTSTWQSLVRGTGSIETDYLNGEIVLLGRLHGVPIPVNELLQRLAHELARERKQPIEMPEEEFLAMLGPDASTQKTSSPVGAELQGTA